MKYEKFISKVKSDTIEKPLWSATFYGESFEAETMKQLILTLQDLSLANFFYLNFHDCQITDEALEPLLNFLTSPKCPEEISLNLNKNQITHHSATLIAATLNSSVSKKITLSLSNNPFQDEGINLFAEHFKPNKNLTGLSLGFDKNSLTEACVPHLTQIISATRSFSEFNLNISDNSISDTGVKLIIDTMTLGMSNEFGLDVEGNGLTSETTQHLLNTFQNFQGTQTITLNLASNNLGDTGFNHLLQLMAAATCSARFKNIQLSKCGITSDSIKPLANNINAGMLPHNLCLNLGDNELNSSLNLLADALVSPACPTNLILMIGSESLEDTLNPYLLNEAEVNQFIETFKTHNPAVGLRLHIGMSGSKEQRQELERLCRETALNAERCANLWMGHLQEGNRLERLPKETMAHVFSFVASSAPREHLSFFKTVTNGYARVKKTKETVLSDTAVVEETSNSYTPS